MAFESWSAFWLMGKHGLYVWLSYGAFFISFLSCFLIDHYKYKQLRKLKHQLSESSSL